MRASAPGAIVLLAVLLCSACASGIRVTPVTNATKPAKGNPWNLPMTQFTVTLTRHIASCGTAPKGTVEVVATTGTAMDRTQEYVLEGGGFWGTSDIKSTLAANGTSTGLNAQSADQTATVISNVVATLGQAAIFTAARATPAARAGEPPPPPPPPPACLPDIQAAVETLYPTPGAKPLKQIVDDDVAALAAATARVTLLTTEANIDASRKPALLAALDAQTPLQAALNDHQLRFSKALAATTDTQVVRWPADGSEYATASPFLPDDAVLQRWVANSELSALRSEFAVYMALFVPSADGRNWDVPKAPVATDTKVGVPVRLGQSAMLVICRKAACTAGQVLSGGKDVTVSPQIVLQLGQTYVVPVTGGTFKAETATIALDSNGLPTSIEVVEQAAAAVALSGASKDAATQVAALPAQMAAARLAATKAKSDQLTADATLATAQANASVAGRTSALAAQTNLINAQTALTTAQINAGLPLATTATADETALLTAQAALVNAQANAGVVDQTGALAAQTTLLNAQAAQINAAAALAKAKVTTH